MGHTIGIDLGTTNTVAAYFDGERVRIITSAEGSEATPSAVSYTPEGTLLVGAAAARNATVHPTRTILSVKRHMGTDWTITIDGNTYTPVDISAAILAKVAADAADRLGTPVTDAVITVPAYFTDAARQATLDAAEIAGLNVTRLINEPTAAILAYDLSRPGTVAVFDVGGGTYDVSVVNVDDGLVEVLATAGDAHCGGDDVDAALAGELQAEARRGGIDTAPPAVRARLLDAARDAKHTLSTAGSAHVSVPWLSEGQHLDTTISRARLDALAADFYARLDYPWRRALADSGLPGVDTVILVGGTTRIPAVAEHASRLAGRTARRDINPDTAVAVGAAIQAWKLSGDRYLPTTTGGGHDLVPAAAANLPAAADAVLVDVTGHSLGLDTDYGNMSVLIRRNTTIPTVASNIYTTVEDNQSAVIARIYQGEHSRVEHNIELGSFRLDGITPGPAGQAQIRVDFAIDADGVLDVAATDLATGATQSITLFGSGAYTDADIDDSRDRLNDQRTQAAQAALSTAAAADADHLCEQAETLARQAAGRARRKLDKAVAKVRAAQRRGTDLTGPVADLRAAIDTATGPLELT